GAKQPARLWPLSAGVLRDLPGEGLALVSDSGALEFRAKLPGGAPYYVLPLSGMIGVALSSGSLAGLDATDGRILWKRRLRARALLACGARLLAVSSETLSCLDPQTGQTDWEREVPPDTNDAAVHDGAVAVLAGGAVSTFSLRGGERRRPLLCAAARRRRQPAQAGHSPERGVSHHFTGERSCSAYSLKVTRRCWCSSGTCTSRE